MCVCVCLLWWNIKYSTAIKKAVFCNFDISSLLSPSPLILPVMKEDHQKAGYITLNYVAAMSAVRILMTLEVDFGTYTPNDMIFAAENAHSLFITVMVEFPNVL